MTNTTTTTAIRIPNYTDAMVNSMIGKYTTCPSVETVAHLAKEFGKTKRSIIAKLVREGVYKATPRVTKTGAPVVRKAQIVADIMSALGATVVLPSLEKASKADLEQLLALVRDQ